MNSLHLNEVYSILNSRCLLSALPLLQTYHNECLGDSGYGQEPWCGTLASWPEENLKFFVLWELNLKLKRGLGLFPLITP